MDTLRSEVENLLKELGIEHYRIHVEDGVALVLIRDSLKIGDFVREARRRGLDAVYSELIPDYFAWREGIRRSEIYVPEDLNDIADNLWKLREDIDRWKLVVDVPQEVVDLLLLGDRREIFFQLKKWGWDRRLEVVYFIEWFENYYGQLDFWREAIEKMGANPFGRYALVKVRNASSEASQG